ncbi:hypothetical protein LWI28_021065 [Acer negundo]|uniref:Uncharacterized protein n=1 Tax=Acer negundo TaxID=4023 RepID=A0AAD5IGF0_ACENE|nr:hypothetical protein LWI28_021065 [Acer negundo]
MKGFNLKENQEREDTVAFMLIIHFLLTPKVVNNIHKRGGTIPRDITWKLRYIKDYFKSSDTDMFLKFTFGGDGTLKGASVIFEEI